MSVEGEGPRPGTEAVADTVVPEGRGDVRGIGDLTYRIIAPYLRYPVVRRVLRIVLIVLAVLCLVATGVRLSLLPLVPIPLFGVGYYCLRRARAAADDDRALLLWSGLVFASVAIGFWTLSVVANHV